MMSASNRLANIIDSKKPSGFFSSIGNCRLFMKELAKRLNILTWEDWYKVKSSDYVENNAGGLLQRFENSPAKLLMKVFPQHPWKRWKFERPPLSWWKDTANQLDFFNDLGKTLNFTSWEDWYQIRKNQIQDHGGSYMLTQLFDDNHIKAVTTVFPQYPWDLNRFAFKEKGFYSVTNHRELLDIAAKTLNIKKVEDWYDVSMADFNKLGFGNALFIHYGGSQWKALIKNYPEKTFEPWKFSRTMKGFWDNLENVKTAIEAMEKQFEIKQPEDWYSVTAMQITRFGALTMLKKYGGLLNVLSKVYPNYKWDYGTYKSVLNVKTQSNLFKVLNSILPEVNDIQFQHPTDLVFQSGKQMIFDIYIPSLNIAFEYQGHQHYQDTQIFGETSHLRRRDEAKREACQAHGITLIEIPFWWDLSKESLKATIHRFRPDIIKDPGEGKPIPDTPNITPKRKRTPSTPKVTPSPRVLPYALTLAKKIGNLPQCRGCGKRLVRGDLRIEVVAVYVKPEASSYIHGAYFCTKIECLEKGFIKDSLKPGKYIQYEQFQGKIWISKEVQQEIEKQHMIVPELEGIEWVCE